MKRLLALLAGFVFTLGVFAAGAAGTFFFLVAEPVEVKRGPQQDIAELWSPEPRSVEPEEQDFVRVTGPADIAAAQRADEETETSVDGNDEAEIIDMTTTAALPDAASAAASPDVKIGSDFLDEQFDRAVTAHVEWCADRYRSYRPRDNSYTPYSGGRRTCVSPYSEEILAAETGASDFAPPQLEAGAANDMQYVADEASADWVSEEHRQYCASRYRSYRPADNTYQPYGGGPRKECL